MSEAIIAKRKQEYTTTVVQQSLSTMSLNYVESTTFIMPSNVVDNTVEVTLAGAGDIDGNNGEITSQKVVLEPGEAVPVYIGKQSTGATSFGTYAIANGANTSNDNEKINTADGYAIINYTLSEEVENNE